MVLPRPRRDDVIAALRRAHPYEEPAFDVFEMGTWASDRGMGRIGRLRAAGLAARRSPTTVADALPRTVVGARVSGDLHREVEVVAVAGGAGDFMLDLARVDAASTSTSRRTCAPPGLGVPRASGCAGADRRTALGGRVDLAAGRRGHPADGARSSAAWRSRPRSPASAPTRGTIVLLEEHPSRRIRSASVKADPFAQLKLLDLQQVDAHPRPAGAPASHDARARRAGDAGRAAYRRRGRARPGPDRRSRTSRREQRKADADVEQVKTRRDAQPAADRRRSGRRPQAADRRCSTSSRRSSAGSATSRTRSSR